ncbi:MAG: hypothetical protein M0018_09750 [Nitrospiraceae bacterium]|nr:hypothetical protein [Nitrospiraceae bacterium]
MLCSFSQLDGTIIDQIKSAERKLGKTLLAYNCYDTRPETLSAGELKEIEQLEKKLGVLLVAVKQPVSAAEPQDI